MRVLIIPLMVMGTVVGELSNEPSEAQMRGAFEQSLALQVRNAIEFVAESGGPQAAQEIQQNGTDRFELRKFEKHACARMAKERNYMCDFAVAIEVVNGSLQHTLSGRFVVGSGGFVFTQEETESSPSTPISSL